MSRWTARGVLNSPFFLCSTAVTAVLATGDVWADLFRIRWWHAILLGTLAVFFTVVDRLERVRGREFRRVRQRFLLDDAFERHLANLRTFDDTLRMNLMRIAGKQLEFMTQYGFTETDRDRDLILKLGQGVAGTAAARRCWAIGLRSPGQSDSKIMLEGGSEIADIDYNMDQQQREKVSHLQLICCYPVLELVARGLEVAPAGRVIAILSLDSQQHAGVWADAERLNSLVAETLPKVAHTASYIL